MKILAKQVRDTARPLNFRDGDAGIDLALPTTYLEERRGDAIRVPSGWSFEMEGGWHLLALQKSRHWGQLLVEAPLIDNSYRGEVHLILRGATDMLKPGDYVVQLVPIFIPIFTVQTVNVLSETTRGEGAFGSTV